MDLFTYNRTSKHHELVWPINPHQAVRDEMQRATTWRQISKSKYLLYRDFDYKAHAALPDQTLVELPTENGGWTAIYLRGGKTEFLRRHREITEANAALCGLP